jgi:hypothetical protein
MLLPVPTWLVNAIYNVIRSRVQALANFDINDIVPLDHGANSSVPALFMHGRGDSFITPRHSEELFSKYGGHKEIMFFDGDHNSERSEKVLERSVDFLCRSFRKYEIEQSVAQQLADVHFSIPVQDGMPHRIPHLPRPSIQRKALADLTNVARLPERQNNDEELNFQEALSEASGLKTPSGRRPPPRKFDVVKGGRRFTTTPPRQPITPRNKQTPSSDGSPVDNLWAPRNRSPEVLLTNRVYPSKTRPSIGSDAGEPTHRGTDSDRTQKQAAYGGA